MDVSIQTSGWDGVYPGVVLQHEWRDVDLLRSDAGEELVQVVQVADFVLHPRHAEGGEEPRGDLEWRVCEVTKERGSHQIKMLFVVLPGY